MIIDVSQAVKISANDWIAAIQAVAPQSEDLNLDAEYRALPKAAWVAYGQASPIKAEEYNEWHQCWAFAIETAGDCMRMGVNGVAIVIDYGQQHAFNLMAISDDGGKTVTAGVWEPQQGAFVDPTGLYNLTKEVVVIV